MILDIVFFVVIVLFAALGFVRGLFKTLVSFFGWTLCLVIAYLLARVMANTLLTAGMANKIVNGALYDGVYGLIPDSLKQISMFEIKILKTTSGDEAVKEYIAANSGGLLSFASSVLQAAVCKEMYLSSALTNVGQILALELTYQIYVILVGVAIFILLRIIVMGLSIIINTKLSGRKTKLWERLSGLWLGVVRGFAIACLLLMVFSYIAGFSAPLKKQNDESKVSVPVTSWINDATSKVLSKRNEGNERYENLITALEEQIKEEGEIG